MRLLLTSILLLLPAPAFGQITHVVTDPSATAANRAQIDVTQSGNTPIVNIAAPNAAGLSHNKFLHYNVEEHGLILNNINQVFGVSSLVGGQIVGNPNLQGGESARIILTEVTGTSQSTLRGITEVAGAAAQLILANPNGIYADGAGFINTPRVTLTTGTPYFNGNAIGFDVNDGTIIVAGRGIDTGDADAFDIISRAAKIAANIHTDGDLNIVTGRNKVDYATLTATPKTDDGSDKPTVAIDSSALGGMYANRIRLVATEKGVGVNLQGRTSASAGSLFARAAGKVRVRNATATGNLTVQSTGTTPGNNSVEVEQVAYAGGDLNLSATGDVNIAADAVAGSAGSNTLSGDQVTVASGAVVGASLNANGVFAQAARNLEINAATAVKNEGQIVATGDLTVATVAFENLAHVVSGGVADVTADSVVFSDTSETEVGNLVITSTLFEAHGDLVVTDSATLTVTDFLQSGTLTAGSLTSESDSFQNDGIITVADAFSATTGTFSQDAAAEISANELSLTTTVTAPLNLTGRLEGGSTLAIQSASDTTLTGEAVSFGTATLTAPNLSVVAGGRLAAEDTITLNIANALENAGAIESANGTSIQSASFHNTVGGLLFTEGSLTMGSMSGSFLNEGELDFGTVGGSTAITANTITNAGPTGLINTTGELAFTTTGGDLDLQSGSTLRAAGFIGTSAGALLQSGDLQSPGQINLTAQDDITLGGTTNTDTGLSLTTSGDIANGSDLYVTGNFGIAAGNLTNTAALAASGDLSTQLTGDLTNSGTLLALGSADLRADGTVTNSGAILADGDVNVSAVDGGRALSFTNSPGAVLESWGGDVTIRAGTIDNLGIAPVIQRGVLRNVSTVTRTWNELNHTFTLIQSWGAGFQGNSLWYYDRHHDNGSLFWELDSVNEVFTQNHNSVWTAPKYVPVLSSEDTTVSTFSDILISAPTSVARLTSSRDILLDGALIRNEFGQISAAHNLEIRGGTLTNVADSLYERVVTQVDHGIFNSYLLENGGVYHNYFQSGSNTSSTTAHVGSIASTIEAGGTLTGSLSGQFSNLIGSINSTQPTTFFASAATPNTSRTLQTLGQGAGASLVIGNPLNSFGGIGALFRENPRSSVQYLFESKSDFIDLNRFLGSDYFFERVSFPGGDYEATPKRLGDAYFETNYVNQQLFALTGRRFVNSAVSSDLEQMRYLIDNSIEAQDDLRLRPGVALSAEQFNRLGKDIVWMVEKQIGEETVLEPVLYLSKATRTLLGNGSGGIVADSIDVEVGSVINTGSIVGSGEVSIRTTTGDIVNDGGSISSLGSLELSSDKDFLNRAGSISGGSLSLRAAGDFKNVSVTTEHTSERAGNTELVGLAAIKSSGDLNVEATGDISFSASTASAAGDMRINAKGNLEIGGLSFSSRSSAERENASHWTEARWMVGSDLSLTGGGSLYIGSNNNISITASEISSDKGTLEVNADKDLSISAGESFRSSGLRMQGETLTGSIISEVFSLDSSGLGGESLKLVSGGNVDLFGSDFYAEGSLSIDAGESVMIRSGEEWELTDTAWKANGGGFSSPRAFSQESYLKNTSQRKSFIEANTVAVSANDDINVTASELLADESLSLKAENDINILSAEERSEFEFRREFGKSGLFSKKKTAHEIHNSTTQVGSLLSGGTVSLTSGNDTNIIASVIDSENLGSINATGDIRIGSAANTFEDYSKHTSKSWLFKSSATDQVNLTTQTGSVVQTQLGNLTLKSGKDTEIQGSSLFAGGDLTITAEGDLTFSTSIEELEESHEYYAKGFTFSADRSASGFSLGVNWEDTESSSSFHGLYHNGSSANAGGNLNLSAGNDVLLTSAQLGADGDTAVKAGGDITLDAAMNSETSQSDYSSKSFGVGLNASGGKIGVVAQVVSGSELLAKGGGEAGATGVAAGVLRVTDPYKSMLAGFDSRQGIGGSIGGPNLSIGFNFSKTESHSSSESLYGTATTIGSGGDVSFSAGTDFTSIGAQVDAGGDLSIEADGDVTLTHFQDTHESESSHKSTGFGISLNLIGGTGPLPSFSFNKSSLEETSDIGSAGNTSLEAGGTIDIDAGGTLVRVDGIDWIEQTREESSLNLSLDLNTVVKALTALRNNPLAGFGENAGTNYVPRDFGAQLQNAFNSSLDSTLKYTLEQLHHASEAELAGMWNDVGIKAASGFSANLIGHGPLESLWAENPGAASFLKTLIHGAASGGIAELFGEDFNTGFAGGTLSSFVGHQLAAAGLEGGDVGDLVGMFGALGSYGASGNGDFGALVGESIWDYNEEWIERSIGSQKPYRLKLKSGEYVTIESNQAHSLNASEYTRVDPETGRPQIQINYDDGSTGWLNLDGSDHPVLSKFLEQNFKFTNDQWESGAWGGIVARREAGEALFSAIGDEVRPYSDEVNFAYQASPYLFAAPLAAGAYGGVGGTAGLYVHGSRLLAPVANFLNSNALTYGAGLGGTGGTSLTFGNLFQIGGFGLFANEAIEGRISPDVAGTGFSFATNAAQFGGSNLFANFADDLFGFGVNGGNSSIRNNRWITSPPTLYRTTNNLETAEQISGVMGLGEDFIPTYLGAPELAAHQLHFIDGKVFNAEGNLFSTVGANGTAGPNEAIFVMDANGRIFSSNYPEFGIFHHSSFLAGRPVAAAGTLIGDEGRITFSSDSSGHYKPASEFLEQFILQLNAEGIRTESIDFRNFNE